jgi:hypothetical protein
VSLEVRDNRRRPCLRVELDCTAFGNKLKRGPEALVEAAVEQILARLPTHDTAVSLHLTGRLNLDRIALDVGIAGQTIQDRAGVFAVALDAAALNADLPLAPGKEPVPSSRAELELRSIRELVEEEKLWGLTDEREQFASLLLDLKEAVKADTEATTLGDQISASPLVPGIQAAKVQTATGSQSLLPAA